MLRELHVLNLVIVSSARLEMGAGLTVISGETGAGKSLLLDALHLLLGGRGNAQLVGPAGDHCSVSGVFDLAEAIAAAVVETTGVDCEDGQLILRRRLGRNGRSQAWINDVPVSIAALQAVGRQLVDIRVQHEHLRLADVGRQLDLLDRYGGLVDRAREYAAGHARCLALADELANLETGDEDSLKELDYLRFLHQEIDELGPEAGELTELDARQQLLAGAQHWQELAGRSAQQLAEDDEALGHQLGRLGNALIEAPHGELAEAGRACLQAADLVREAAIACARLADGLEADPAELARIDDRLARYHDLLRKHGGSEAALLEAWQRLADRIAWLDDLDGRRDRLAAELAAAEAERKRSGAELAKRRRSAFRRLGAAVQTELAELGMPKARLSLAEESGRPTALGSVHQEIHIATNPGLPAGPLAAVASGGESARMTLALAVVLAEQDDTPVMVFDEVDSGVGGRLGAIMGAKLAALARNRTVMAVTHTPQLAAAADHHYLVRKRQEDDATDVEVVHLTGQRRRDELADMLGGGKAAMTQARELLAKGRA